MVDTDLFMTTMKNSGFSVSSLSRRMGISNTTLNDKIQNSDRAGCFTVSERFYIRHLFDLTKDEEIEIFGKEEEVV